MEKFQGKSIFGGVAIGKIYFFAKEEKEITIDCDMIIMAVGSKKNAIDVEGVPVPVYYAGDCAGERTASIAEAIRTGYKVANEI